jgi:cytochrome b6-f complex iron-sulfur subunit
LTAYPSEAIPKAQGVPAYKAVLGGMESGLVALYQKCPHLGCRVPQCESSQWFECPCHGSQYNRVGEKKAGPAPRGMDHFAVSVSPTGDVTIDTSLAFDGAPIGTNTTGQEAEGPHCVSGGGH